MRKGFIFGLVVSLLLGVPITVFASVDGRTWRPTAISCTATKTLIAPETTNSKTFQTLDYLSMEDVVPVGAMQESLAFVANGRFDLRIIAFGQDVTLPFAPGVMSFDAHNTPISTTLLTYGVNIEPPPAQQHFQVEVQWRLSQHGGGVATIQTGAAASLLFQGGDGKVCG